MISKARQAIDNIADASTRNALFKILEVMAANFNAHQHVETAGTYSSAPAQGTTAASVPVGTETTFPT